MKQTEKLASAVCMLKSAGMKEKLQDAEVWASRHKAKPEDMGFGNIAKVEGGKLLGILGGAGLGLMAGRAGGALLLKNLIKNLHLKSMGRMGKSDRIFKEVNDLNFAKRNMDQYKREGKDLGGYLGMFTGTLGGGAAGGAYATSHVKPDMIKNLRASGYPKN